MLLKFSSRLYASCSDFNLSNSGASITSIVLDEILTIRKHGTPHDAAIIDYQEERKLDAEQLFHHVYSGSSSLRRVYFEPEIYFLEFINKILYLRQTSFALLKSTAASIKKDASSSLILTLRDYNLIISRISKVMSDAQKSMRAAKNRRKCPQVLIRRRRILY